MTAVRVPLCDLTLHNGTLQAELVAAATRVLGDGRFIAGPDVEALEQELRPIVGASHVVGLSSGTDALLVALMALEIGPADEVVTTPFSFMATASCIARVSARPVFADIDPLSFNLDPLAAAAVCGTRTRAIVSAHLFGCPAESPSTSVPWIEDAAQALGAQPLVGKAACHSFFPTKNLGGFGDGGALACADDALADRVRLLRAHGSRPKYVHHLLGGNFRLDTLQAALLRVKLRHLAASLAARREAAARYRQLIGAAGLDADLRLPPDVPGHTYNQFVIRAPRREKLRERLAAAGVETAVYYPLALHLQPCFAGLGYRAGAFPHAETATREALALPMFPGITEDQQTHVVAQLAAHYGHG